MTTSADWPHGVDPMPSMEPSSDLFGDILGDELIDIYNAAVVGGSDDDTINGTCYEVKYEPLSFYCSNEKLCRNSNPSRANA